MPNQEKTPRQTFRADPDDWEAFGAVAGHRQRGGLLRAFIRWYLRRPGAKLPKRPPAE